MKMKAFLPPWPREVPRNFQPLARFRHGIDAARFVDALALQGAHDLGQSAPRMSNTTGTWTELMFANGADFTAVASTSSEASLLAGQNEQPTIPALLLYNKQGLRRAFSLIARGVFSTTGTPTLIFQVRTSTTAGSSTLSGASLGVSAAITTQSGVTNKWWELRLDLITTIVGTGTGNTTLAGAGYVKSPGGFASPFTYALEPTTPDTATWTQTLDNSLTQYLNLSVTWSASSSSNTITAKQVLFSGLN